MRARVIRVLLLGLALGALGVGMLTLAGLDAERASASPKPLCIGPTGAFVVCGGKGQGTVLPTSPTTATGGTQPTTSTTLGSGVPLGQSPVGTPIAVLHAHAVPPHGEDTDVIVIGIIVAVVLGAELVALVALNPRRHRHVAGGRHALRPGAAGSPA